jgi:hypothetical protein
VLCAWIVYASHFDIETIGARYRSGNAWTPAHRKRMLRELESWTEFKKGRLCAIPHKLHADVIYLNDDGGGIDNNAEHPHSHNDAKYAPGGVPSNAPDRASFVHGDVINFLPECGGGEKADESAWMRKCWTWMTVLTEDAAVGQGEDRLADALRRVAPNTVCDATPVISVMATLSDPTSVQVCGVRGRTGHERLGEQETGRGRSTLGTVLGARAA